MRDFRDIDEEEEDGDELEEDGSFEDLPFLESLLSRLSLDSFLSFTRETSAEPEYVGDGQDDVGVTAVDRCWGTTGLGLAAAETVGTAVVVAKL